MTAYEYPVLKLEGGFGYGPFTIMEDAWWTDITSRMQGFNFKRGRQDQTAAFEPGTLTVTLDSSDRMLDPTFEDSLVYIGDDLGLPLMPVRLTCSYDGDEYTLFRGFLSPEGWPVDAADHGPHATVDLQAVDPLGWYSTLALPSSAWAMLVSALEHPDGDPYELPPWWIRGDVGFPAVGVGGEVPNRGTAGGAATIEGDPDAYMVMWQGFVASDLSDPSMRLQEESASLVLPKAGLFPGGDIPDATFAASITAPQTRVGDTQIMALTDGATDRFRVSLEGSAGDEGALRLDVFDAVGVLSNSVTLPPNPGSGDGQWGSYVLVVRITGGTNAAIYANRTVADIDTGIPGVVREGDLTIGPVTAEQGFSYVDEVLMWPVALTTGQIHSLQGAFMGSQLDVGEPFARDTFTTRIDRWYNLAGLTIGEAGPDAFEPEQWHSDTPEPTFWGVGDVGSVPTTLAEGLRQVATDTGGACWATREGRVRVRSRAALDDATFADDYVTQVAHLTDDVAGADPSPTPVNRGPVKRTGTRLDRIINEAAVTFASDPEEGLAGTVDVDLASTEFTIRYRDEASITRYGVLRDEFTTSVIGWETSAYLAANRLVPDPPIEVETIRLSPIGNQAVTDFVVKDCELEKAVKLSAHPEVGDPWSMDLNVMGETWDWQASTGMWTVDLNLADLRGDPA